MTQDELIARALDNEEGNIVDHRDYLKVEEEKRKRARVIRATVNGPLLRWVSKGEEVTIKVIPDPPASIPQPSRTGYPYSYAYGTYNSLGSTLYGNSYSYASSSSASSSTVVAQPSNPYVSYMPTTFAPVVSPPVVPQVAETKEKVTNNYVVHESTQRDDVPNPSWSETMAAMFGDHVKWDEIRVYAGKGRPTG